MRELTIVQCKELEHGEIIPSFRGRIKKVFEQKKFPSDYGDGMSFIQNMIVAADGQEITVTWTGEDDMSSIEGETRLFESSETKHGLQGVKRDIKTSKGKVYEGIRLTGSCKIKPVNGNLSGGKQPAVTAGENAVEQKVSTPHAQNSDGITEARKHLCQAANLYNLCVKCVETMVAPELPEIARTSEQFQATLASLWIEASSRRCTDGVNWWSYIERMPIKTLSVHERNEKVERMPSNQEEPQMRPEDDDCAYPPEEIEPLPF